MSYKIPVVTDTGMVYVPIVTANSVRGLIRRCAADVLYAEMQRQGIMVSKELYLSMCRGAFGRTQIDSSGGTTEQAINAAQHCV
jgi:CRISPR type IV-associated protein Csf2